jgi:hypothetical protein
MAVLADFCLHLRSMLTRKRFSRAKDRLRLAGVFLDEGQGRMMAALGREDSKLDIILDGQSL